MLRIAGYSFGALLVFGFLAVAGTDIAPGGAIAKTVVTSGGGQLRLDAGNAQIAARKLIIRRPAIVVRPRVVRPRVVRPRIVARPRGFRGRHFGRVIYGVTLGTVIVVAVARTAPPAPNPEVCWVWTNGARTRGYWYYCAGD